MLYSNQSGVSHIAPAVAQGKEASPLTREICILTETVDCMEQQIGKLQAKLEPVLLPMAGGKLDAKLTAPQKEEVLAKAPDWVRTQRQRMQDFNIILDDLLNGLQV